MVGGIEKRSPNDLVKAVSLFSSFLPIENIFSIYFQYTEIIFSLYNVHMDRSTSKDGIMARNTVLREQVYEQIKHDIITCKLSPGEPLSENQFLDQFQVSKTPIREALTSLVQDGLVEYTPNRGFMVTAISILDINEIFEERIFFETEFFRMSVKNISDADIDQLEGQSRVQADSKNPSDAEMFL